MINTDGRIKKTDDAIREAVCRLLSSVSPDRLTIKAVSGKSGVSLSAIRKRASSPQRLLGWIDAGIRDEFLQRRSIQINELGVGGSVGDFFMRW